MNRNDYAVISVGGSLTSPTTSGPDIVFLKKLKSFVFKYRRWRFVLVCGGGMLTRSYIASAKKTGITDQNQLDLLGIKTTQVHAQLVASLLNVKVLHSLMDPIPKSSQVIVASGYPPPGKSTDYIAVQLARKVGEKRIINLTNIDYVYDKDPVRYKNAKKLLQISWPSYKKIIGGKWKPGLNSPFDPRASKLAQKYGMEVIIANGRKFNNLKKILSNKAFIGTVIN